MKRSIYRKLFMCLYDALSTTCSPYHSLIHAIISQKYLKTAQTEDYIADCQGLTLLARSIPAFLDTLHTEILRLINAVTVSYPQASCWGDTFVPSVTSAHTRSAAPIQKSSGARMFYLERHPAASVCTEHLVCRRSRVGCAKCQCIRQFGVSVKPTRTLNLSVRKV